MAYTERDLHPYVKMIVEEEGSINTTDLNIRLRQILTLDEIDLEPLQGRNDDKFSQIVRNLVRYTPNQHGIVNRNGYLIDKNSSPATFYAIEYFDGGNNIQVVSDEQIRVRRSRKRNYIARKVDYEKKYEENQLLGDAGERFVLDYERFRLREQEVPFDVLNEVLHTSKQYGDGAGYDILSKFDFSGRTLYIEVKTTKGDLNTPFFISINELSFLEEYQDCALIYRVYNFDYFSNTGEIELITYNQLMSDFYIDAITFKVSPRFHY